MIPLDPSKYEAYIKRQSELKSGKNNPNYGKHWSEEIKRKISQSEKGKYVSPETRSKIAEVQRGRPRKEETKQKIRNTLLGTHRPIEVVRKISESQSGEKSHNWQGGKSFEPYCPKFTKEFKERVRAFFGYRCGNCQAPQLPDHSLHVHHVNYNKQTCCDNTIPLFIPLCDSCHGKSGWNRDKWEAQFTHIITTKYGGKCYLPKEISK